MSHMNHARHLDARVRGLGPPSLPVSRRRRDHRPRSPADIQINCIDLRLNRGGSLILQQICVIWALHMLMGV